MLFESLLASHVHEKSMGHSRERGQFFLRDLASETVKATDCRIETNHKAVFLETFPGKV